MAATKRGVFECKIDCKSTNGPTVSCPIEAGSRNQAAQIAADRAGEFCARHGHSHASAAAFSESRCQAR